MRCSPEHVGRERERERERERDHPATITVYRLRVSDTRLAFILAVGNAGVFQSHPLDGVLVLSIFK
jgi:hypothetical protein